MPTPIGGPPPASVAAGSAPGAPELSRSSQPLSGALRPNWPTVAGFVPPEGHIPRRSGAVVRPWSTSQPFQRVRGSRGSTSSVELVPASSGQLPNPVSPSADEPVAQQTGLLLRVSEGVRSTPPLRTVRSGEGASDTPSEWFGVPLERSTPLPLDRLKFSWCRYARSGVTVGELLARETLRPDLLRVRKVYEAGRGEEASLMLGLLLAEGDGAM